MATKMNKTEIIEMLFVLADMITAAKSGTNFVEISTYVKNHVPGIEPEFVEAFRDILGPILHKEKHNVMRYSIYCTSNRCDGHIVETLEGTLQDAIDWFYDRFGEVSVETEIVGESLFPCLISESRDDDGGYWRYAMVLWVSEI